MGVISLNMLPIANEWKRRIKWADKQREAQKQKPRGGNKGCLTMLVRIAAPQDGSWNIRKGD
jgi:hypothetical protein